MPVILCIRYAKEEEDSDGDIKTQPKDIFMMRLHRLVQDLSLVMDVCGAHYNPEIKLKIAILI
jgi:hypothetical protein